MHFKYIPHHYIKTIIFGGLLLIFIVIICICWNTGENKSLSYRDKCSSPTKQDVISTLEMVHIVFRHGSRTPVDTYPNDPYLSETFFPIGWGHITNKGKNQLYETGKWLRSRYAYFLEPFYSPNAIYAQATASPRALMSLATVLASMFAPKHTPMEWNEHLNWQPVPIFSEPLNQDSLLLVRSPCPRFYEARDEVLNLPEVRADLRRFSTLFENLTRITGMPVTTADDINSLYITLEAEKELGLVLPQWTKDYFPDKMRYLAEKSYIYNTYTREMQKIKGGPFLKKMFTEMKQKQQNTLQPSSRKFFIYTGHDWTVGNILSALKVWTRQMPRFSIMAIFELHKSKQSENYFIKIFLKNGEKDCVKQLKVPNCEMECPLDKLIALSNDVLPNETFEQRCTAKNKTFIEPPSRPIDHV